MSDKKPAEGPDDGDPAESEGATSGSAKSDKPGKSERSGSSGGAVKEASRERTSIPTFYRQVVAELRKVVYPTQEQLVTYFIVVLFFVLVMMGIIAGLDLGFGKLVFSIFTGGEDV